MMRKPFTIPNKECKESTKDSNSFEDHELLNLRLTFTEEVDQAPQDKPSCSGDAIKSTNKRQTHPLRNPNHRLPNLYNLPQGYNKKIEHKTNLADCADCAQSNDKVQDVEPTTSQDDCLSPTTKNKEIPHEDNTTINSYPQERPESRTFPFKLTPSGNFKVNSDQVIFVSDKFSVLVADPANTQVNINSDPQSTMSQPSEDIPQSAAMAAINEHFHGSVSNIGSVFATSPTRSSQKEASEYDTKKTCEILEDLDLSRLGYSEESTINWDKVKLPEKKNLYLELHSRIINYKNTDCKVCIGNEEFNCHLIVLQCYSEAFNGYSAVKKVELPQEVCSATTFAFIYEWMISGEPSYQELTRHNVLDIFTAAKYLKMNDLVEQCWYFIDDQEVFSEATAFFLYMTAKKKNLREIREIMIPRIQNFFLMLVGSQDWLELDIDDVKDFLTSNYISINCEMEVFMSAVRWLKHDWDNRSVHKYQLLECVRFGNIAPWQLIDIKRNPENPEFMELTKDPMVCKMIDDGLAYVIIKYWYGQENSEFQHWNSVLGLNEPPIRNWTGCDKTYFTYREFVIYLDQYRRTHLDDKGKAKKEVTMSPRITTNADEFMCTKKENLSSNPDTKTPINPNPISKPAKVVPKIEIAAKPHEEMKPVVETNTKLPDKCDKLFPKKVLKLFQSVSKMNTTPDNTSLFNRDKETVLIFGGFDPHGNYGVGRNTGKDIFQYKPRDNTWEYVGDLPEPRYYHCIAFFRGRVYLVGGADPREEGKCKSKVVNTVWSFDPTNRYWYHEGNLMMPRKHFGLVVCNQMLFAIGGQDKQKVLRSVEKYNIYQSSWEEVAPLKQARTGLCCSQFKDCIWVAGGLSGLKNSTILDSVECYNTKTNQWTEITKLSFPRCFSCLFLLQDRLFIIGGAEKSTSHSTSLDIVEQWDEDSEKWKSKIEMEIPRHGHIVTNFGTQLMIIGGVTTAYKKALNSIECFCIERGTWVSGISNLPNALSGHAAVTLPPSNCLH